MREYIALKGHILMLLSYLAIVFSLFLQSANTNTILCPASENFKFKIHCQFHANKLLARWFTGLEYLTRTVTPCATLKA